MNGERLLNVEARLRRLAMLGLALLPGVLLEPAAVIDRLMPLRPESLEIPPVIDFGELRPNERRAVKLAIGNRTWRRVMLRPIKVDCGCLVASNAPSHLAARGAATVSVTITAPAAPGEFARNILVQATHGSQPSWLVVARGRVAAAVWAEPSELDLVAAPGSMEESTLTIQHVEHVTIERVAPTMPLIELLDRPANGQALRYTVRVGSASTAAGSGAINVYADADEPVLSVPVRWSPPANVAYAPARLELAGFGEEAARPGGIRRVVAVVVPPDRAAEDADLEVLVPWVRIAQKSAAGSVLRLELEFDERQMPAVFHEAVLSAQLPGDTGARQLAASGRRG